MDERVGARLREARARRKINLEQVEAETKIRVRYLRAIENEEWDLLPGDAYARAFVRAYAAQLGLDGDRIAEDYRRERGLARPGERLVRGEPTAIRASRRRKELPSVPPRVLAVLVSAALIGVLVAIGLTSGGDGGGGTGLAGDERPPRETTDGSNASLRSGAAADRDGLRLSLLATAEVWVCLLDGKGEPLVEGLILSAGTEEGPYRSGSFTVALGNGAVEMTVDGKQASIPETSSPIGFEVGPDGSISELPEGERPTCT